MVDDPPDQRPSRPLDQPPEEEVSGPPSTEPLSLRSSFGTAVGASMLGLEQALRDGPPPQIQAAEQAPDRAEVSGTGDLTIRFPEPLGGTDEESE